MYNIVQKGTFIQLNTFAKDDKESINLKYIPSYYYNRWNNEKFSGFDP